MSAEYIPKTGDIVTVKPNPTYKGVRINDERSVCNAPEGYKWVVDVFPAYPDDNKADAYALYSLISRGSFMNEGVFVDAESLDLVFRVDNPAGF